MLKQRTSWLIGLALIALLVVSGAAFAACGGSDDTSTAGPGNEAEHTEDDEATHDDDEAAHDEGEAAHDEGDEAAHDEGEAAHDEGDEAAHDEGDAHSEEPGEGVHELTVGASDTFTYAPAELHIGVGEHVRIVLDNTEAVILHDITVEGMHVDDLHTMGITHEHDDVAVIDEDTHGEGDHDAAPEVHVAAEPGGTAYLEFTATEAGVYTFFCTVPGHRDAGMEGTIIVE